MKRLCVAFLIFSALLSGCNKKVKVPDVADIQKVTYHGHWETKDIGKIKDLLGFMESIKRGWKQADETLPHTEEIISIEMAGGEFERVFLYDDSIVFQHLMRELTSSDKVRMQALFHRMEM